MWDEMAPICSAMGTLTKADVKSFRTFCELQSTLEQASAMKGGSSEWVTLKDEDDRPESRQIVVVDAVLKLERDTATALRPFYEKFGLEPVGRARIQVKKPDAPMSKWADLA